MIAAIVAVDNDWGIGFNGKLLEHIPDDLKRFKQLTAQNIVIMGRKTWDSLPKKPLPNRLNIVITRQERQIENMTAFISLGEAWSRLTNSIIDNNVFIIGGGQIYEKFLPLCEKVYVTKIYKSHNNIDTFFPNLDSKDDWKISDTSPIYEYNNIQYQYIEYSKIDK